MAKHLTDKRRKEIIADSVEGMSLRALAAKYNVSTTTIQRTLKGDTKLAQKVAHKKEENTVAVLAHMDSRKKDVCELIDTLLAALQNPEKIAATPLNQIATTMGILIDKYTANEIAKLQAQVSSGNLADAIMEAYTQRKGDGKE